MQNSSQRIGRVELPDRLKLRCPPVIHGQIVKIHGVDPDQRRFVITTAEGRELRVMRQFVREDA